MKLVGEFCRSFVAVISVVDFNVAREGSSHFGGVVVSGLDVVKTRCWIFVSLKDFCI
jgi:hypothetical protein